jgi:hypothetical protein
MNIETIVNFLSEQTDRLYPFNRTYKLLNHLSDISEYIKINLKPNIKLEELGHELKVNIILINDKLEFNYIDLNYNKYICLIQHKNKYEFAYVKQNNSKEIYIFTKKDIGNINLIAIQNNDEDDDEDYKEITETYDKPTITIDESDFHTEEYNSVNDILKKELGDISDKILEETTEVVSETINIDDEIIDNEPIPVISTSVVSTPIVSTPAVSTPIVSTSVVETQVAEPVVSTSVVPQSIKTINGVRIPNELIVMDDKVLKKMLKGDMVKYFMKENSNISQAQMNKYTKEKLFEMIRK